MDEIYVAIVSYDGIKSAEWLSVPHVSFQVVPDKINNLNGTWAAACQEYVHGPQLLKQGLLTRPVTAV